MITTDIKEITENPAVDIVVEVMGEEWNRLRVTSCLR